MFELFEKVYVCMYEKRPDVVVVWGVLVHPIPSTSLDIRIVPL